MTEIITLDERNRLAAGPKARERFGDTYYRIITPDGIVFRPVPQNPEAQFKQDVRRKLPKDKSWKDIREEARKEAEHQAME